MINCNALLVIQVIILLLKILVAVDHQDVNFVLVALCVLNALLDIIYLVLHVINAAQIALRFQNHQLTAHLVMMENI